MLTVELVILAGVGVVVGLLVLGGTRTASSQPGARWTPR